MWELDFKEMKIEEEKTIFNCNRTSQIFERIQILKERNKCQGN